MAKKPEEPAEDVRDRIYKYLVETMRYKVRKNPNYSEWAKACDMDKGQIQKYTEKGQGRERLPILSVLKIMRGFDISFSQLLFVIDPKKYKFLRLFDQFTRDEIDALSSLPNEEAARIVAVVRAMIPRRSPNDKKNRKQK